MATGTLTGQTIANTYKSLLKITGTTAGGETLHSTTQKVIEDGDGNPFPFSAAQDALLMVSTNRLEFGDTGTYIHQSGDGVLSLVSDGDIILAVGSTGSVYHTGDGGTNNTIYGYDAGTALASGGDYNAFFGYNAGASITTGDQNVAIGQGAMQTHTTGNRNIAIGHNSMVNTDAGSTSLASNDNLFIGVDVGGGTWADTASHTNVAIGNYAMDAAMNAALNNTAVGYAALGGLTEGDANVVVGYEAGIDMTIGDDNTLIGNKAGENITESDQNVIIGSGAGATMTSVNNCVLIGQAAGDAINSGDAAGTIAIGYHAGGGITDGSNNTMIGYQSGVDSTGGGNNTYLGYQTAANATQAGQNVVIGYKAAYGNDSTAWTGDYNVIIGHDAGGNVEGNDANHNTFLGFSSGQYVSTGQYNTAVGSLAMYGDDGTAMTGDKNTCLGFQAGELMRGAAEGNTCIGAYAGEDLTTGSNNILIGHESDQSSNTGDNAIVMGHNMTGASNTFVFGKASNLATSTTFTSSGGCTFAFSSDGRRKRNIQDNTIGLDLINKLQTKTFQWKPAEEYPEEWKAWDEDDDGNKTYHDIDTEKVMHGFIAQEVKETLDKYGVADSLEVWAENEKTGEQRVHEGKLIVPLIKAVQELSQQVEDLKKQIN